MSLHDWISTAQTLITAGAMALLWIWRRSITTALMDQTIQNRLTACDTEIERLRKWRHDIITPWQQTLIGELEDRFVTRREWDQARNDQNSPWPDNRRKTPR